MSVQYAVRNQNVLPPTVRSTINLDVNPFTDQALLGYRAPLAPGSKGLRPISKVILKSQMAPTGLPAFSKPQKESKTAKFARELFGTQKQMQIEEATAAELRDYLGLAERPYKPQIVQNVRVVNLDEIGRKPTVAGNAHASTGTGPSTGPRPSPLVPPTSSLPPTVPMPPVIGPAPAPPTPRVPPNAAPALPNVVNHNFNQIVHNHHYLTQNHRTEHYQQVMNNTHVAHNVIQQHAHHHTLNQQFHQQNVHNTLNQQQNNAFVNLQQSNLTQVLNAATQNNLVLNPADVGMYQNRAIAGPRQTALVTGNNPARLGGRDPRLITYPEGPHIQDVTDQAVPTVEEPEDVPLESPRRKRKKTVNASDRKGKGRAH